MRMGIKELMDNLGVGNVLTAYETSPWSAYDDENDLSCNAEVRMNSDGDELEAELQILRNNPKADELSVEQVYWMIAKPAVGDQWDIKLAKIKGESKADSVHNWEGKSINFFQGCVQDLKMGNIPNIEEILERALSGKEKFSGSSQGGGSKSPKIKPQALLGMKGGRGF